MAQDKVHKVMHEFKHGELHSGSKSGPKVTNRQQAIAIALSEARRQMAGKYAAGGLVVTPPAPTPPLPKTQATEPHSINANYSEGGYVHPKMYAEGGAVHSGHWIQGAIKHPGQLHRDLGVPQGQKIPESKLHAAEQHGGKVGQRARLAETLRGFAEGGKVEKPGKIPGVEGKLPPKKDTPEPPPPPPGGVRANQPFDVQNYIQGGPVSGPGTATSDSVPANLSDGEYVIPADVVQFLGAETFDRLVQHVEMMLNNHQASQPWDELFTEEDGKSQPTQPMPSHPNMMKGGGG